MNIIRDSKLILDAFAYESSISSEQPDVLLFESATILGFVAAFDQFNQLLSNWERLQDWFLVRHAAGLRLDPRKAWSAYSVLLCRAEASAEARLALAAVEEDFRGSHKI